MTPLAIAIIDALLTSELPEDVLRYFLSKLPAEKAQAILTTEYETARQATDAEAKRVLLP
jgi:hypothetical protein